MLPVFSTLPQGLTSLLLGVEGEQHPLFNPPRALIALAVDDGDLISVLSNIGHRTAPFSNAIRTDCSHGQGHYVNHSTPRRVVQA